jgi:hypothetical protein
MKGKITLAVQKNNTTIYYKLPLDKLSNKQKMHFLSYKIIKANSKKNY